MNSDIINTKVYGGRFLDIYIDTLIKDNKVIEWQRCSRKNKTNAVMIVAKHIQNNKYVLTSEFRMPINDREIGFPAGLIEENESIETTIKRELKEETGLDLVNIIAISPLAYNSSGMTDQGVYIAYVLVDGETSQINLQDNEDIKTFLLNKDEINNLLQDNQVKWGSKAWLVCVNLIGMLNNF